LSHAALDRQRWAAMVRMASDTNGHWAHGCRWRWWWLCPLVFSPGHDGTDARTLAGSWALYSLDKIKIFSTHHFLCRYAVCYSVENTWWLFRCSIISAVKVSWIFYGTSVGPALGFKCFLHEIAECSNSSSILFHVTLQTSSASTNYNWCTLNKINHMTCNIFIKRSMCPTRGLHNSQTHHRSQKLKKH